MTQTSGNARLEALSDGVFAIAMTLLIIEVKLSPGAPLESTADVWAGLQHLAPSLFAFVLSFGVIFITWVNHHAMMKLVPATTGSFIYANGLLLLTVVIIPFPAALLGEFLGTDHAAPAVVLYDSVLAVQAIAWILVSGTALRNNLTAGAQATATLREGYRNGYFAFALYGLLAVAALWFPRAVAIVTTISWIFWLVLGIRMRRV